MDYRCLLQVYRVSRCGLSLFSAGLSSESVWIIEAFQRNIESRTTAGEIVLKHWQFCYNEYGVHADRCPRPCTRDELMQVLREMQRYDLLEGVLRQPALAHSGRVPQENLTFDLNSCYSVTGVTAVQGQAEPLQNMPMEAETRVKHHANLAGLAPADVEETRVKHHVNLAGLAPADVQDTLLKSLMTSSETGNNDNDLDTQLKHIDVLKCSQTVPKRSDDVTPQNQQVVVRFRLLMCRHSST